VSTSSPGSSSTRARKDQVGHQPGWLGPARPLIGQWMRSRGPVPASRVTVTGQLAADRGRRPPQTPGDKADRLTPSTTQGDLFPLTKRQVTPLQAAPAPWAHTTGLTNPRQTAVAAGAGDGRGISHELTALPRGPERLDQPGHQLVRETNGHRHPHILGCCDDRENPRILHWDDRSTGTSWALKPWCWGSKRREWWS
jgi:hypothetical protein